MSSTRPAPTGAPTARVVERKAKGRQGRVSGGAPLPAWPEQDKPISDAYTWTRKQREMSESIRHIQANTREPSHQRALRLGSALWLSKSLFSDTQEWERWLLQTLNMPPTIANTYISITSRQSAQLGPRRLF